MMCYNSGFLARAKHGIPASFKTILVSHYNVVRAYLAKLLML